MNPEISGFEKDGHNPQDEAYLLGKLYTLTDNKALQEQLLPQLAEIGAQNLPPEELVPSVIEKVAAFAQENMNGMEVLALNKVPEYIGVLVQDPEENDKAMSLWQEFVDDFKESSAREQANLPRTLKKALRKAPADRRPGERARVDRYNRRNRSN